MFDIKKFVEEIKAMTVLELNDVVKALEEEFGVSAAAVAVAGGGAAGGAPAAEAAEEKTEFDVILSDAGANKIAVIKVVRELTGAGLVDAKKMVESAPIAIKEQISKDAANEMVEKFKEAGATCTLK